MNCWRRISSALVFLYFHILQIVWCETTVAPLCKSGENCTTASMATTESPVSSVRIGKCSEELNNYCLNGQCLYLLDMDEHYCRCESGYGGLRCTNSHFLTQPVNEKYLALTIFLTAMLLLAVLLVVLLAYKWYALKKSNQPNQKYKEVSAQNI